MEKQMTDTIRRQAVIARIKALSGNGAWSSLHVAISRAVEAINAIPAVTVTDDMVERAVHAYQGHCGESVFEDSMRAALVAALGETT